MRIIVLIMLFAASAFAQGQSVSRPASCGPEKGSFDVKLDKSQHALAQPDPGKARVYFIQDDGSWGGRQQYVLDLAMDGVSVGAYKNNSYFTVSVEPGEHHVCASTLFDTSPLLALAHFTAEPGKVYYFRTRFLGELLGQYPAPPFVDLDPVDSDHAKYMIASFPLSVSQPKPRGEE